MLEDYEDSKYNLLAKWREVEQELSEGCSGGVCSVGSPKQGKNGSNTSHNGDGTNVTSINGMTRKQEWQPEGKVDVTPQSPDTEYEDPDGRPFTAEEKYDPYWAGYYLELDKNGYTVNGKKEPGKIEENEIRVDDPQHTHNDIAARYAQMTAAEDDMGALHNVVDHFEQSGQDYDIMVRVGETTKTAQEWEAEIERTNDEGLPPEVPDLPPTEGGYSPEDNPQDTSGSMMPFPELGEPPVG